MHSGRGFGGYDVSEQQVRTFKIPISFLVRSPEEKPWGLGLRVPVSFRVNGSKLQDLLEGGDLILIAATSVKGIYI